MKDVVEKEPECIEDEMATTPLHRYGAACEIIDLLYR